MRLLPLLLAGIMLAGCLGANADCPKCAVPTNVTANPPTYQRSTAPPDLNDPGYVMQGGWHVGDGWDYQSNESNYHTFRVLQQALVPGHRILLVEETEGIVGAPPHLRYRSWIEADTLVRYNLTYTSGRQTQAYDPPDQRLRFTRNGTFLTNESAVLDGSSIGTTYIAANSYFAGFEQVKLAWGKLTAARIEHRIVAVAPDGTQKRDLVIHWVDRDYGADVQYDLTSGERFYLFAVRWGNVHQGTLAPT